MKKAKKMLACCVMTLAVTASIIGCAAKEMGPKTTSNIVETQDGRRLKITYTEGRVLPVLEFVDDAN